MDASKAATEQVHDRKNPGNRRRGNRHVLNIPATMQAEAPDSVAMNVTVIAMSVGGIGIATKLPAQLNEIYHLSGFDTLLPPGMRVRVVSERRLGETNFEIGAEVL